MRVLLSIFSIFFVAEVWAACTPMPSCEELNYTDTKCEGEFITCPFDQTKKKCLPLPTPVDLCAAYPLSTCPSGGVCESCPNDSTRVRLASCESSSPDQLCSDYPLSGCPTYGICDYCPDNNSRAQLTGCEGDYYHFGSKCYPTTCPKASIFANRRDLVIKAIEESSILNDYAKAWRSGGWLANDNTFSEEQIQMYVKDFALRIQDAMNNTFCYNRADNMYVYAEDDYYRSKYSDNSTAVAPIEPCCAPQDSAYKSTICTVIRDYVKRSCEDRRVDLTPLSVSGNVCEGTGQAMAGSKVEIPNFTTQIANYNTLCERALEQAGLRVK